MVEKVRAAHEFCSMAHRGLWSPTLDAMKLRQGWGTLGCGWFRKSEGGPPAAGFVLRLNLRQLSLFSQWRVYPFSVVHQQFVERVVIITMLHREGVFSDFYR
jgi:hypothetical protein